MSTNFILDSSFALLCAALCVHYTLAALPHLRAGRHLDGWWRMVLAIISFAGVVAWAVTAADAA